MNRTITALLALTAAVATTGCSSTFYEAGGELLIETDSYLTPAPARCN